MLELKKISKVYKTATFEQSALNEVSLNFKAKEFVSILGPSGSGKTSMLNIIGGLDSYTSGDLQINGKSTKGFKSKDWDRYRNNSIGFIFQSYNLINHISVIDNVEMAMTLSGVNKKERRNSAIKVLEQVGLKDHIYKRPTELSGGQKQRVAIARALSNNPDIILADEPTGALDTKTSKEIMELIKSISEDKLVIMVTHNSEIAEEYSSRIIKLRDGVIESDSNPVEIAQISDDYMIKKTAMKFTTALKLSFNNLRTKAKRTLITAFAGSIGIAGVSLVLSVSNGMNSEIASLESDQLSNMPITINETAMQMQVRLPSSNSEDDSETEEVDTVITYNASEQGNYHYNDINEEYLDYISNLDEELYASIEYQYGINFNLLYKLESDIINSLPNEFPFEQLEADDVVIDSYDIVAGDIASNYEEAVLVVEDGNQINEVILQALGFSNEKEIEYEDIIGTEIIIARNDDYYQYDQEFEIFRLTNDLENTYNNGVVVKIVGIVRSNADVPANSGLVFTGVKYHQDLTDYMFDDALNSKIVLEQQESEKNVLTGLEFSEQASKSDVLKLLGGVDEPVAISIYAKEYESKAEIQTYLDEWNEENEDNEIMYTDLSEQIAQGMTDITSMIQTVLVIFASISLVVSSIMIGIITYVSVLERTKEIGILRSLGASKKNIKSVFNAETFIVGLIAGSLGILLSFILSFPINSIMSSVVGMSNIMQLEVIESVFLIVVSILLTSVSGLIPSSIAAKKDPVEALRSE